MTQEIIQQVCEYFQKAAKVSKPIGNEPHYADLIARALDLADKLVEWNHNHHAFAKKRKVGKQRYFALCQNISALTAQERANALDELSRELENKFSSEGNPSVLTTILAITLHKKNPQRTIDINLSVFTKNLNELLANLGRLNISLPQSILLTNSHYILSEIGHSDKGTPLENWVQSSLKALITSDAITLENFISIFHAHLLNRQLELYDSVRQVYMRYVKRAYDDGNINALYSLILEKCGAELFFIQSLMYPASVEIMENSALLIMQSEHREMFLELLSDLFVSEDLERKTALIHLYSFVFEKSNHFLRRILRDKFPSMEFLFNFIDMHQSINLEMVSSLSWMPSDTIKHIARGNYSTREKVTLLDLYRRYLSTQVELINSSDLEEDLKREQFSLLGNEINHIILIYQYNQNKYLRSGDGNFPLHRFKSKKFKSLTETQLFDEERSLKILIELSVELARYTDIMSERNAIYPFFYLPKSVATDKTLQGNKIPYFLVRYLSAEINIIFMSFLAPRMMDAIIYGHQEGQVFIMTWLDQWEKLAKQNPALINNSMCKDLVSAIDSSFYAGLFCHYVLLNCQVLNSDWAEYFKRAIKIISGEKVDAKNLPKQYKAQNLSHIIKWIEDKSDLTTRRAIFTTIDGHLSDLVEKEDKLKTRVKIAALSVRYAIHKARLRTSPSDFFKDPLTPNLEAKIKELYVEIYRDEHQPGDDLTGFFAHGRQLPGVNLAITELDLKNLPVIGDAPKNIRNVSQSPSAVMFPL